MLERRNLSDPTVTFVSIEHTFERGGSMTRPVKYTKEMLEEAVQHCVNFAEVMRYFGLKP